MEMTEADSSGGKSPSRLWLLFPICAGWGVLAFGWWATAILGPASVFACCYVWWRRIWSTYPKVVFRTFGGFLSLWTLLLTTLLLLPGFLYVDSGPSNVGVWPYVAYLLNAFGVPVLVISAFRFRD